MYIFKGTFHNVYHNSKLIKNFFKLLILVHKTWALVSSPSSSRSWRHGASLPGVSGHATGSRDRTRCRRVPRLSPSARGWSWSSHSCCRLSWGGRRACSHHSGAPMVEGLSGRHHTGLWWDHLVVGRLD